MSGICPDYSLPREGTSSSPALAHPSYDQSVVVEKIGAWTDLGSTAEIVLAGDSEIPPLEYSEATPINRRGWRYPLQPIKFDRLKGEALWAKVRSKTRNSDFESLARDELLEINEPERSNLHSFLVNVFSYSLAVPEDFRDVPLRIIVERSLTEGPSFAEYMSGLKAFLFAKKCHRRLFSDEISLIYQDNFPTTTFRCVGDIFRSNQLFYWTPPNPDIVAITAEDPETTPRFLEEFRTRFRELLEEKKLLFFKPNNDYKSLYTDNTKSAQEGKNWKLEPAIPSMTRAISRIAFIPRELSESRAAAVEQSDSVLRIRWIDSEVRRILATQKSAKMDTRVDVLRNQLLDALKERIRFNHIVKRKEKSERWAYCRDFRKEGLTKNRAILRIMLEELGTRFPTARAFEVPWFFDEWKFELDGVVYSATRGHGLGMANALTTLMQIVIEKMTLSRMVGATGLIESFYNNDDAALIFDSEANAIRYSEIDRGVCDNLGLAYKDKSTYIAHQHLNFCEQYISQDDVINDKTAYSYDTLFQIWKAVNASHARSLSMSMNLRGVSSNLAAFATEYWGPVLYRNEFKRPRCLGGWFRQIENTVDISFININGSMQVPQMEEAANWAYDEVKLEHYPWLRFSNRRTKAAKSYPNEWLLSADVDLYIKRENTFKAESDVTENVRAWKAYEKKLRESFSRGCSWWQKMPHRRRTFSDIYRKECDDRPKEDIIPPANERIEVNSFEASYTTDVIFEHPYRAPSRAVDLAVWCSGQQQDSYPRKMGMTGQLHIGSKDIPKMKKGAAQRAISLRHLYGETRVPLKVWNMYLVPSQDTFEYWHNPFAIGAVADAWSRNYNSYIPEYISPKKKELLQMRKDFYGRDLTWKEWMTIGTLHPADIQMLSLFKECFGVISHPEDNDVDNAILVLVREFRRYPGFGAFMDSLQNFEEETIIEGFSKWMLALEISRSPKTKKEKEDEDRNYYALIDAIWNPEEVVQEIEPIHEFYESRNLDPKGIYDIPEGEPIVDEDPEKILDEFFQNLYEEEEILDEVQEDTEAILDEFWG